jgi:hypothetical protein
MDKGCMKLMGEAMRDVASTLSPDKQIVLLGIANWTTIRNNHILKYDVRLDINFHS